MIQDIFRLNNRLINPSIIVTDFSWALINAVLESFNKTNIYEFMDWAFNFISKKTKDFKYPVIIYLCATHFLKIINTDIKKRNINLDTRVVKSF